MISSIEDITLHGKDWDPVVKEFMGRVQKLCAQNGSLASSVGGVGGHLVSLPGIKGHENRDSATNVHAMWEHDMWVLVNKGTLRGDKEGPEGSPLSYAMRSKAEATNLKGYLCSDFARICLSLVKVNQHNNSGELALVPWLDFTQTWDDDKLFSMLGYPKGHPIREYAKRFLPDYHNIYPNGKNY